MSNKVSQHCEQNLNMYTHFCLVEGVTTELGYRHEDKSFGYFAKSHGNIW